LFVAVHHVAHVFSDTDIKYFNDGTVEIGEKEIRILLKT
jgi:hypothetical protein